MLYERIIEQGTVGEPEGKPDPDYALPSTVNWMRSLCLLAAHHNVTFPGATAFYAQQGRRQMTAQVENTVLEQLFLALHHLSGLERLAAAGADGDLGRIGVVAWYYGISNAASAMIAAQNGSFQEDHSNTARMWDEQIVAAGHAMEPFRWRVSSLVESTFAPEVEAIRAGSGGNLQRTPYGVEDARGVAASYLSGSAKWYAWLNTEHVRESSEFRRLGVANFRTKAARELRDRRLAARRIGFLHQAFRYRGKANYREALFLAYGRGTPAVLNGFVTDQAAVLKAFLAMAGAFAARKLGRELWREFVADVEAKRAFSLSPTAVWS